MRGLGYLVGAKGNEAGCGRRRRLVDGARMREVLARCVGHASTIVPPGTAVAGWYGRIVLGASSFVTLMRRYVEDYTNGHDVSLIPELMHPGYTIHIGGLTLGFDEYVAMVEGAYERFPDLQLVVHNIVTNGERLALHFSEYATSPAHDHRFAVWEGIGLYRRSEDGRLSENLVEQDFYGRRQQLAGTAPPPTPVTDPAVWSTADDISNHRTEAAVRSWVELRNSGGEARRKLEAGGLAVICNGTTTHRPLLAGRITEIDDLFSAGDRFGVRLTMRGVYAGDLHDAGSEKHGRPVSLAVIGVGTVQDGKVATLRLVTDRFGLRRRLLS